MDSDKSGYNSPKRKRDFLLTPPNSSPMLLNTTIPGLLARGEDDGPSSPRTKVAYHFQGLQLDGGDPAPVSKFDLREFDLPMEGTSDYAAKDETTVRKRMKVLNQGQEVPETPQPSKSSFTISFGPERNVDPIIPQTASKLMLHNEVDPVIFKGATLDRVREGGLGRAYPSINRLSDSKSRGRKRMGTPPFSGSAENSGDGDAKIVDPDQAALTWHVNEITGHDPDDPDDDGEGINGIGFRPTPAIAFARMAQRKRQMEEYKSREAREARAKRSERRRESERSKPPREDAETARRVRFLESESKGILSTP
ncbi:hypothetical protein B7494_g2975 [Chlorociboria aeruginascens]|nr:hypothetical protein B7494_g2975 [Chlorociboria aeruginascens]